MAFGTMQKDCPWVCDDLDKGSYLCDFSAAGGSCLEKLGSPSGRDKVLWTCACCSMKGNTEMGWGVWMDEMGNANGRDDSPHGSVGTLPIHISLSPPEP